MTDQFPETTTRDGHDPLSDAEWFDGGWLYVLAGQRLGYWISSDGTVVRLYERADTDRHRRFRPVLETDMGRG